MSYATGLVVGRAYALAAGGGRRGPEEIVQLADRDPSVLRAARDRFLGFVAHDPSSSADAVALAMIDEALLRLQADDRLVLA